jgi:hypothetical protein
MQATYGVWKSPLVMAVIAAVLLAAIVLGGAGGYFVRGALGGQAAYGGPIAAGARSTTVADSQSTAYVQGGRPPIVYTPALPSIYVQGGRPQVVYDEIARLAGK